MEPPNLLGRQLRTYLSRQVDHGRMKRTDERIPRLEALEEGVNELACPKAEFSSDARLEFRIQFEATQRGWLMRRFQFHLHLEPGRRINMVRIHLNADASHDPLVVPRCHMHVGNGEPHIPFPIMDPRLILCFICEHLEPDLGV